MYGCESWTIKEAECRRIDAFELWCWRRSLRVPWTARRSNQSIQKEISPELFTGRTDAKAETPILWAPDLKNWFTGKTLMLEKIEGRRRGGKQNEMVGWHHRLNGHGFEQALGVDDGQGILACCSPWFCKEANMIEPTELNWTETKENKIKFCDVVV